MKKAHWTMGVALGCCLVAAAAQAQKTDAASASAADNSAKNASDIADQRAGMNNPSQTFYLTNLSSINEGNEIQTALRNMLPQTERLYYSPTENAIIVRGTPEDLAYAQRIVRDLDRPKTSYRLTYTLTSMDNGKRGESQKYSMVVAAGQRTQVKLGSKLPLATGSYSGSSAAAVQTQFQYIDVGMSFDATLDEIAGGARLKTKVEQSSAAASTTIAGVQEPVIRQATLEGTAILTLGKPLMLGSLDVPGSTSHLDVEVVMEPIK